VLATHTLTAARMRHDGYAPIADYAAVGDGRTVALVARDGAVDWLCLPDMDSPSVFGALLDAENGGRFALAPTVPFESERRYVPDTNVLETTFRTAEGVVRVLDALTLPGTGLEPLRELARRVEGLAGTVPLAWSLEPRFRYGSIPGRVGTRNGIPVAQAGTDAVAVLAWGAGEAETGEEGATAHFEARAGERALVVLAAAHQEPLVFPERDETERRLDETCAFWRRWTGELRYGGPWKDEVVRSALALKLLVYAPSGAIAASPTTSLPEVMGGQRNWDYRFAWVRDTAFALEALMDLGADAEAHAFFWWLLHASQHTHPRLQVLYRLDGGARATEHTIQLAGYRGSSPVRVGNDAVEQSQLDIYGDLLQMAWVYVRRGHDLDHDTGKRLAEVADLVAEIWRRPDLGIWEVRSDPLHFTHSKMMCFVALDCACRLAEEGRIPAGRVGEWRAQADAVREFVESRCYSSERRAYVRFAGADELDASVLLAPISGYCAGDDERIVATIDAVSAELGRGPFLMRYTGEDGLEGDEGAFVPCSFWLVEALARSGRLDEAVRAMEEVLPRANDVGLFAEEVEPDTGKFLGNFPQGLTHLALISAASAIAQVQA
jgi:GH15 family glucan-1,4-alpha-glucosidase